MQKRANAAMAAGARSFREINRVLGDSGRKGIGPAAFKKYVSAAKEHNGFDLEKLNEISEEIAAALELILRADDDAAIEIAIRILETGEELFDNEIAAALAVIVALSPADQNSEANPVKKPDRKAG